MLTEKEMKKRQQQIRLILKFASTCFLSYYDEVEILVQKKVDFFQYYRISNE